MKEHTVLPVLKGIIHQMKGFNTKPKDLSVGDAALLSVLQQAADEIRAYRDDVLREVLRAINDVEINQKGFEVCKIKMSREMTNRMWMVHGVSMVDNVKEWPLLLGYPVEWSCDKFELETAPRKEVED